MNHYVYEITNLVNGKKYIGKRSCKCNIEDDKYMGSGKYLQNAIKKYGIKNFTKDVLEVCETEKDAFSKEKHYIAYFNASECENYYNISKGGDGFSSEDIKKRWESDDEFRSIMSIRFKQFWNSDDFRYRISYINSESMKKKWEDEEYRQSRVNAMRDEMKDRWENNIHFRNMHLKSNKRLWKDEEYVQKMRNGLKKKWEDEEYRQKMICKAKDKWKDEEYRQKIRQSRVRKVILINTYTIFNSLIEASEFMGFKSQAGISACCRGRKQSAGKIKGEKAVWMYYEDYLKQQESNVTKPIKE